MLAFPLWLVVALPWLAALICLLLARLQVRALGPGRATQFAHYLALGASVLALLFLFKAIGYQREGASALADARLLELLEPVVIGGVRIELRLVADKLASSAALVILAGFTLARMFIAGSAGQRALGLAPGREPGPRAATLAVRRLGLLGLLEGAALLFVLAYDLGLAALGWAVLGVGAAVVVASESEGRGPGRAEGQGRPSFADERRASAATRVLATSLAGDLALGAAAVLLIVSGVTLIHNEVQAPRTGELLYAIGPLGLPMADLLAAALLAAALLRSVSLAWAGNSLAEALLDAVVVPVPTVYLLLRYQRVLAYAPTVLAIALVFGLLLALAAGAVALVRPARGVARRSPRPGGELGLAGTGLAWTGLIAMAIGVAAWRTAALLLLAQALGRLGLRLALLVARNDQLPPWSAQVGRVLTWAVAGVAPGLGFVALTQTLIDVLTRASLLAPWISWPAAAAVLVVAFAHAAAIARIWYEQLGRKPGLAADGVDDDDEDGLDFAPLVLCLLALLGLGLVSFAAWFELGRPVYAWLELQLPLIGGHELAPIGLRPEFRDGLTVARPWVAGSAALVALVTGFAWTWARERFRRAHGTELAGLTATVELLLVVPRRIAWDLALALAGLTELAARGIGRGLFEEGPEIAGRIARDAQAGVVSRLRRRSLGGARSALLGIVFGLALVLGWLYGQRDVASLLPSDDYGFGGLRPKLIRAGGSKREGSQPPADEAAPAGSPGEPVEPVIEPDQFSTPVAPQILAPRRDAAEPAPLVPEEGPR